MINIVTQYLIKKQLIARKNSLAYEARETVNDTRELGVELKITENVSLKIIDVSTLFQS